MRHFRLVTATGLLLLALAGPAVAALGGAGDTIEAITGLDVVQVPYLTQRMFPDMDIVVWQFAIVMLFYGVVNGALATLGIPMMLVLLFPSVLLSAAAAVHAGNMAWPSWALILLPTIMTLLGPFIGAWWRRRHPPRPEFVPPPPPPGWQEVRGRRLDQRRAERERQKAEQAAAASAAPVQPAPPATP